MTLGPEGKSTLAEAVDAAVVPESAVLVAVTRGPKVGVTLISMAVPIGSPLAAISTVTGLVVVEGSVISADPVGFVGAGVPAIAVMEREGFPGTKRAAVEPKV